MTAQHLPVALNNVTILPTEKFLFHAKITLQT